MLAQFGACRSVSGDYAFKPCCQSVAMTSEDPDELNRLWLYTGEGTREADDVGRST